MPSQQFLALAQRYGNGDPTAPEGLIALAQSGDADAQYAAAEFRLLGFAGPVDAKEARSFIEAAADSGHPEARRARAYFVAAGVGAKADSARAHKMLEAIAGEDRFVAVQLAFLKHVQCHERLRTANRQIVSEDPHVELIQALFSPEECRYMQTLAAPWLRPAKVYSEGAGSRLDGQRDADNIGFTPITEDLVIQAFNRCIAEATGFPFSWGEPLQVVRYRPGQQFRPHHDAYGTGRSDTKRIATALLYLNAAYEGGETHFPDLGFRVRGGVGDLLIFHNLTAEGDPDLRMTHAGLPVTRGEKWLATRWIRTRDYFDRRGNNRLASP